MKSNLGIRLLVSVVFCTCFPAMASAKDPVVWKNLKKLDDLAEKCEASGEKKDIAALRKIAASVKDTAVLVEKDPPPAGALDAEKVKTLQTDLKSLSDEIGDPEKQDGDELLAVLSAVHPIVEQLMEAAGMPHVHEEEPKKNQMPPEEILR